MRNLFFPRFGALIAAAGILGGCQLQGTDERPSSRQRRPKVAEAEVLASVDPTDRPFEVTPLGSEHTNRLMEGLAATLAARRDGVSNGVRKIYLGDDIVPTSETVNLPILNQPFITAVPTQINEENAFSSMAWYSWVSASVTKSELRAEVSNLARSRADSIKSGHDHVAKINGWAPVDPAFGIVHDGEVVGYFRLSSLIAAHDTGTPLVASRNLERALYEEIVFEWN